MGHFCPASLHNLDLKFTYDQKDQKGPNLTDSDDPVIFFLLLDTFHCPITSWFPSYIHHIVIKVISNTFLVAINDESRDH